MLKQSIVFIGLFMFSVLSVADDMVSRESIKAKVIDVEVRKDSQGDSNVYISLEINKNVNSYLFSPFRGENVFYKSNLTPLPIKNIKIGRVYYIEIGEYSIPNKSNTSEQVYYIGEKPFSFGELE